MHQPEQWPVLLGTGCGLVWPSQHVAVSDKMSPINITLIEAGRVVLSA